jgi:hypothetical protein
MGYQLIKFEELDESYVGRQIVLRTTTKDLAVIEVLGVSRGVDNVNITYKWITGDTDKFKTQGPTACAVREKKNWSNPAKFWLPYIKLTSSRYDLPENNDGMDKCRFCGGATRKCGGWSSMTDYRICRACGR